MPPAFQASAGRPAGPRPAPRRRPSASHSSYGSPPGMLTPLVAFYSPKRKKRFSLEVRNVSTPRDLLNEAKKAIREVDPPEAEEILARGGTTFLDVREPDEYEQGALPNAVHLPRGHL